MVLHLDCRSEDTPFPSEYSLPSEGRQQCVPRRGRDSNQCHRRHAFSLANGLQGSANETENPFYWKPAQSPTWSNVTKCCPFRPLQSLCRCWNPELSADLRVRD